MKTRPEPARWPVPVWAVCLAALIILVCFTRPPSPAGCYVADKRIGQAGDFYYEFSKGKLSFVSEDGCSILGTYSRSPDGWLYTAPNRKGPPSVFRIRYSWWRLRICDEPGKQTYTLRRRFIPTLRPDWVPDWIE